MVNQFHLPKNMATLAQHLFPSGTKVTAYKMRRRYCSIGDSGWSRRTESINTEVANERIGKLAVNECPFFLPYFIGVGKGEAVVFDPSVNFYEMYECIETSLNEEFDYEPGKFDFLVRIMNASGHDWDEIDEFGAPVDLFESRHRVARIDFRLHKKDARLRIMDMIAVIFDVIASNEAGNLKAKPDRGWPHYKRRNFSRAMEYIEEWKYERPH